jgi:pimeloyl-ACP methyl ester carboxylesterase
MRFFRLVSLAVLANLADHADSFVPLHRTTARSPTLSMTSAAESNRWIWKGHSIYTQISGPKPFFLEKPKPAVLLIHGFGCSTTYWRATTSALTQAGYQVHALDLLGQGQSAKPGRKEGVEYSINLWAEMVDDYTKENIGRELVMMGNSLGSVVALSAATGDFGGGHFPVDCVCSIVELA